MKAEKKLKSGVKCKVCGAQPAIMTPIGYAYCESCALALNGLSKSRCCAHCGKALNQDVITKGDVFCSISCAVQSAALSIIGGYRNWRVKSWH